MNPPQQAVELPDPIDPRLLGRQLLSRRQIADLHEAVVAPQIADPFLVELPGQPLAAVEHDMDVEGEPTGDPHLGQTETAIVPIKVVMLALAGRLLEHGEVVVPAAEHLVGHAHLERAEHGDQAVFGDTFLQTNVLHEFFFVDHAGQVLHFAPGVGGGLFGLPAKAFGQPLRETEKVLDGDAGTFQPSGDSPFGLQHAKGTSQANSIKTTENTLNMSGVSL